MDIHTSADQVRIKNGLDDTEQPALAVLSRASVNKDNKVMLDFSQCKTVADVRALLGNVLPEAPATWAEVEDGKTYLHTGGDKTIIVNGARTGVTFANVGYGTLNLNSAGGVNGFAVRPGTSFRCDTHFADEEDWNFENESTITRPLRTSDLLFSRKTTDQSVTNSTTLEDCAGMSLTLPANGTYEILASIVGIENGGGVKAQFTATNSPTVTGLWVGQDAAITDSFEIIAGTSDTSRQVLATALVTTGGSASALQLRFAQFSSNAADSTIKAGSFLRALRVA